MLVESSIGCEDAACRLIFCIRQLADDVVFVLRL